MKLSLGQKLTNCRQKLSSVVERIRTKQPQEITNGIFKRINPQNQKQSVEFIVHDGSAVDGKITAALVEKMADLEALADANRVKVKLTQYGDNLVINTGAVTSYIKTSNIENAKSLYSAVENSIHSNKTPSRTLSHGFNVY